MQPQLLVPPQGEGSEQQVDIGGMKGEPLQLQVINGLLGSFLGASIGKGSVCG